MFAEKNLFTGKLIGQVKVSKAPLFILLNSSALSEEQIKENEGKTSPKEINFEPFETPIIEMKETKPPSSQADLPTAKRIISGGRGMGAAENFKQLEDLSKLMEETAVGASRAGGRCRVGASLYASRANRSFSFSRTLYGLWYFRGCSAFSGHSRS